MKTAERAEAMGNRMNIDPFSYFVVFFGHENFWQSLKNHYLTIRGAQIAGRI
jgi:hypothetical protein